MEWFDVKDRLPSPKRGYYLVSSVLYDDEITAIIGICYYSENTGWFNGYKLQYFYYRDIEETICVEDITHWAPIPKDPRGLSIYNFEYEEISEKVFNIGE